VQKNPSEAVLPMPSQSNLQESETYCHQARLRSIAIALAGVSTEERQEICLQTDGERGQL
jgi:hypothetical protein